MLDKGKVEKAEEKLVVLHNELANIMRATASSYTHGDKYYQDYSNFIATLTTTFSNLQNFSQIQTGKYVKRQDEVRARIAKNEDLTRNSGENERTQAEELTKHNTTLEELKIRMKETVGKLDAKLFGKLDVKKSEQLHDFFDALHQIFYKDSGAAFDWAKFKKDHIAKDNMADFQTRLGGYDFATSTPEEIETLGRMRDDPWLNDYKTKKEGTSLVELSNYLTHVTDAAKSQAEIKRIQEEIARNKLDAPKREEATKADQDHVQFLQENVDYLNALHTRMIRSAEPFANEAKRTDAMIGDYEQHKQAIRDIVFTEYARVQAVPRTIYGESI
jgi:hypothetical protein